MIKYHFAFILLLLIQTTQSQECKSNIQFSGFVKTDIFWDSRQTVDARDGHFLLYPKNEDFDVHGTDINSNSKFNILSIQSRVRFKANGPNSLGAKTYAFVEGAFFGNIGTDINGFRLRHAYIKLKWDKSELLVGQYWHPMFVTTSFPATISFNTGTPFQPFSRNPQLRYTKNLGDLFFSASALSQIDFKDSGPSGANLQKISNTKFVRNSGTPELNFNISYKKENPNDKSNLLLGVFINYKRLSIDRIQYIGESTTLKEYSRNDVNGLSFMGIAKFKLKNYTFKLNYVHGQLLESMTMLGGYALTANNEQNSFQDLELTPINTNSFWLDFHTNGTKWQYGVFCGLTKNKGLSDGSSMATEFYSRGSDIDFVYRISPRIIHNVGKLRLGLEFDVTTAAYGATQNDGTVSNSKEITNYRGLIAFYYFFNT